MKALAVLLALLFAGCLGCEGLGTDVEATRRTLEDSGFTDIQAGGYAAWMCGEEDFYATKFAATNPLGKRVSGAVCCGAWVKGCTVRF